MDDNLYDEYYAPAVHISIKNHLSEQQMSTRHHPLEEQNSVIHYFVPEEQIFCNSEKQTPAVYYIPKGQTSKHNILGGQNLAKYRDAEIKTFTEYNSIKEQTSTKHNCAGEPTHTKHNILEEQNSTKNFTEEKKIANKQYTREEINKIYRGNQLSTFDKSQMASKQQSTLTQKQNKKDFLRRKTLINQIKNNLHCGKTNPTKKRGPLLPTPRRTLIEPVKELKPLLPELQNSTFTKSHFMLIKAIKLGIKQKTLVE